MISELQQVSQDEFYLGFFKRKSELFPIRIGLLFNYLFEEKKICYKTFQRIVDEYFDRGYLVLKKQTGLGGNTTLIVKFNEVPK